MLPEEFILLRKVLLAYLRKPEYSKSTFLPQRDFISVNCRGCQTPNKGEFLKPDKIFRGHSSRILQLRVHECCSSTRYTLLDPPCCCVCACCSQRTAGALRAQVEQNWIPTIPLRSGLPALRAGRAYRSHRPLIMFLAYRIEAPPAVLSHSPFDTRALAVRVTHFSPAAA